MFAHFRPISTVAVPNGTSARRSRVRVEGKFLVAGDQKFYVRGVTYGTFRPDEHGDQFPDIERVRCDFGLMAANGINAIRTYTVPPIWLLDAAWQHGFYVMVGLPWEQHIAFLDEPGRVEEIERRMLNAVRETCGHAAILAYVIGNEIPKAIVRWSGARSIERFLRRLYLAVKGEASDTLVTYVNYPGTEYLRLSFMDFCCFNVYLERREQLEPYLAELQNQAGDRPLVMAEIGLDSCRNGEIRQAEVLDWQIRTVFEAGCAGTFVFSWTDEWYRGGHEIEDWDFGLTRRGRQPKPALAAVQSAFGEVPFPRDVTWPRISVVVCTFNGARTIQETLDGLQKLEYTNYEVIVVDDGSTDDTLQIAAKYPVRIISTANRGLSAARNTGMKAATGSIVAYIDDDAWPDPHWLQYLAWTFLSTPYAAVGGPNIPPPDDGPIAECVAHAPGGPAHVLISAREAEHIPGCNCSFRKECLEAVGGFDQVFRTAGDDVDLCWRLMEQGWKLGFHPAAMVWHRRRNSLRAYWKQQKGYGTAEAFLERKWPSKYNAAGHVTWSGRVYGKGITLGFGRSRIYQGTFGSALFHRLYEPALRTAAWLPLLPEWFMVVFALLILVALQPFWAPLGYAVIPLCVAVATPLLCVAKTAAHAFDRLTLRRLRLLAMSLHIVQPVARLWGRINHGLTPWRYHGLRDWANPLPQVVRLWSEEWHPPEEWVCKLEQALSAHRCIVTRGGDFDRWDLEVRNSLLGGIRVLVAVEDHGAGKQLVRVRTWPVSSATGLGIACFFGVLAGGAAVEQAWIAAALLGAFALPPMAWTLQGCARARAEFTRAYRDIGNKTSEGDGRSFHSFAVGA